MRYLRSHIIIYMELKRNTYLSVRIRLLLAGLLPIALMALVACGSDEPVNRIDQPEIVIPTPPSDTTKEDEEKKKEEAEREKAAKVKTALQKLYEVTGGDNWTDHTNWLNFDVPYGEWYGLTAEDGKVTEIDMYYNNLTGTLPDELADLQDLKVIRLSYNKLTGVTDKLKNLTSLTELDLSGNPLNAFPDIYSISSLKKLDLENTGLVGPLPDGMKQLTNLEYLRLSNNNLTGNIPTSWLSALSRLSHLYMNYNDLEGVITLQMQQTPMWKSLQKTGDIRIIYQNEGYDMTIEGAVADIILKQYSITLRLGDSAQMEVRQLNPDDALNQDLSWEVVEDYEEFVSVEPDGKVTALKEGMGWIMVKAADMNGAREVCSVQVIAADTPASDFAAEGYVSDHGEW